MGSSSKPEAIFFSEIDDDLERSNIYGNARWDCKSDFKPLWITAPASSTSDSRICSDSAHRQRPVGMDPELVRFQQKQPYGWTWQSFIERPPGTDLWF